MRHPLARRNTSHASSGSTRSQLLPETPHRVRMASAAGPRSARHASRRLSTSKDEFGVHSFDATRSSSSGGSCRSGEPARTGEAKRQCILPRPRADSVSGALSRRGAHPLHQTWRRVLGGPETLRVVRVAAGRWGRCRGLARERGGAEAGCGSSHAQSADMLRVAASWLSERRDAAHQPAGSSTIALAAAPRKTAARMHDARLHAASEHWSCPGCPAGGAACVGSWTASICSSGAAETSITHLPPDDACCCSLLAQGPVLALLPVLERVRAPPLVRRLLHDLDGPMLAASASSCPCT